MIDLRSIFNAFGVDFSQVYNYGSIFLLVVGLFWIVIASIQDFRKREVENWWSFSLIVFVLIFRSFFSVVENNYWFVIWGLIGLGIGFLIAELFYYARLFAGGDAKLLMAVFVLLPLAIGWQTNVAIILSFLICLVIGGAVYGLVYSLVIMILHFRSFRREFYKLFQKNKFLSYLAMVLGVIVVIFSMIFNIALFILLGAVIFFYPILFLFAKSVENTCMAIFVSVDRLTIGDWLIKPLKIKGKIIKPYWEGLGEKELAFIQKNYKEKVLVKYGLPFVPAFLIALIGLIIIIWVI